MLPKTLILLFLLNFCGGKRILGFHPFPGKSQQNVFAPILHELARRGHHVVYLTPVMPELTHPNLQVRLIQPFIHKFREKVNLTELGEAPIFKVSHVLATATEEVAEYFYGDPVAQEIIHGSESYDAVTMESYFVQEPVSALLHKFGCVAIEISSLGDSAWINELAGLPDNPAYQIDFKTRLTDDMTFSERLYNFYVKWSTLLVSYYHLWRKQSVMDKYFNYTGWESRPPINKLISNRSIILINRDVVLDYPYPSAPHVKDIGGINVLPNKPLPKDIQSFMDEAENGVIYLSFGSHLQTSKLMTEDLGKPFLSVFRSLPQRILMKWESNETITLPPNIMTYKWIPQQDVLAHKNCVLFISHGGLLSLTESAFHGVPLLGIPFYGDQPKNMMHAQHSGYGIQLALENITHISLSWAIQEILNNPRYRLEARRRSKMLKERRSTSLDEAVYWIEHAMKYPNSLTPKAAYLSFIQLYMIDVKLFLILMIYFSYKFIGMCFKLVNSLVNNVTKVKRE